MAFGGGGKSEGLEPTGEGFGEITNPGKAGFGLDADFGGCGGRSTSAVLAGSDAGTAARTGAGFAELTPTYVGYIEYAGA